MIGLATTIALLRGLHLAGCLSLLGGGGFIAWMLPAAWVVADRLANRLRLVCLVSGGVALLAGAAWFALQAAAIAGAGTLADAGGALPVVALHTRYGHVLMARLGLLLGAVLLVAPRSATRQAPLPATKAARRGGARARLYGAIVLTAAALSLEGLIGHAGATAGTLGDGLVLSESLHLLAAGIWLGALPPLWFSIRALPPGAAAAVCERFSPIGLGCVLLLAGTGLAQGMQLIGSLPALFGTRYGHFALLKIALFLLALMLATINRLWLTDRLTAEAPGAARRLRVSVLIETGIGLAIIAAAAFMAASPPAAESTPVWPFAWLPGPVTNPEAWREVAAIGALLAVLGVALVGAALLWWRRRRADDNRGAWHPRQPDQATERSSK
ncbi:copper resistance D family protein [Rhodopila sp.]|uniref:copper resistance D family protein n=1 Tax=Rhodopila sp. TaxID=2480087 RepID=UPI003D0E3B3E